MAACMAAAQQLLTGVQAAPQVRQLRNAWQKQLLSRHLLTRLQRLCHNTSTA
jgi:hypothetical protein